MKKEGKTTESLKQKESNKQKRIKSVACRAIFQVFEQIFLSLSDIVEFFSQIIDFKIEVKRNCIIDPNEKFTILYTLDI